MRVVGVVREVLSIPEDVQPKWYYPNEYWVPSESPHLSKGMLSNKTVLYFDWTACDALVKWIVLVRLIMNDRVSLGDRTVATSEPGGTSKQRSVTQPVTR